MKQRTLIIITGHPGSGKSKLAAQLSQKYNISYISKNAIKERIFDTLGSKDKTWSLKVSAASHRIMDDFITQELSTGHSVIIESNFKADIDSKRFEKIIKTHEAACIQILCKAAGEVLFKRWNERIAQGSRHEGHVEAVPLEQIKKDLSEPYETLDLPGRLIEIDTTDVSKIVIPSL